MRKAHSGISLVELIVVIGITSLLTGFSAVAVQTARESSRSSVCQNKLRQLGIAVLHYEASHLTVPSGTFPRYSLQVTLLPYLDESARYDAIDFTVFDNPENIAFFNPIPNIFICPSGHDPAYSDRTSYLDSYGVHYLFHEDRPLYAKSGLLTEWKGATFAEFHDGLSNTLGFAEFAAGTRSNRIRYVENHDRNPTIDLVDQLVENAVAGFGNRQIGQTWYGNGISAAYYTHYNVPGSKSADVQWSGGYITSPSSNHGSFINAVNVDGSIRHVSYSIDRNLWLQLGHRSDGGRRFVD